MPEVRRTIHAPPEAVWAVLADAATYPRWLIGAQVVTWADPGFPAGGAAFENRVGPKEKASLPGKTTALTAVEPQLLTLRVRVRPFVEAIARFRLIPINAGTEVALDEEPVGPLRVIAPLLRPLVVARNGASLDRLRGLVESGAPAP